MSNKKIDIDEFSGTETTGHEWDGIKELNNPLPRWWLWTFYACILFAIGYVIYYPAIPLINSATRGISGETTRMLIEKEMAEVQSAKAPLFSKIEKMDIAEIKSDESLYRFAVAGGESLYKVYCTQCHGSGAQGAPGYPNLNDDVWLWGGNLDAIYQTIAHGVRTDLDDDTRFSEMPAFGRDELLEVSQISMITNHVLKISGQEHDAKSAETGAGLYAENCAACHGATGLGDRESGAPNLVDNLWLYGSSPQEITSQISLPKHGVMPAWVGRLGSVSVKQLTLYIHSLGGGEK